MALGFDSEALSTIIDLFHNEISRVELLNILLKPRRNKLISNPEINEISLFPP